MSYSSPPPSSSPWRDPRGDAPSLPYSTIPARAKPGILTAVGVLSIVIGGLGALWSVGTIFQAIAFGYVLPAVAASTPAMVPTGAPAPLPPTPAPATTAPAAPPAPAGPEEEAVPAQPSPVTPSPAAQVAATQPTPTATTAASVTTRRTVAFPFQFGQGTTALVLADGAVSLGLAVFLVVVGILTLTGSRRARGGHLLWAWLKLPALLLTGVSTALMTKSLFDSIGGATTVANGAATPMPSNLGSTMAVAQAVVYACVGCVYPVSVLIVMRTRRVKAYYDAGAGAAIAS